MVGFQPTGWTHQRELNKTRARGRRQQKGTVITYQVLLFPCDGTAGVLHVWCCCTAVVPILSMCCRRGRGGRAVHSRRAAAWSAGSRLGAPAASNGHALASGVASCSIPSLLPSSSPESSLALLPPPTLPQVPYSEHSSFTELRAFVGWLNPVRIIPHVNTDNGGPKATHMVKLLRGQATS